jgi:hypothetical protein
VKFSEWLQKEAAKEKVSKTALIKRLSKESGVSVLTLQGLDRGAMLRRPDKAKAVVTATNGKVKLSEICEISPEMLELARSTKRS